MKVQDDNVEEQRCGAVKKQQKWNEGSDQGSRDPCTSMTVNQRASFTITLPLFSMMTQIGYECTGYYYDVVEASSFTF